MKLRNHIKENDMDYSHFLPMFLFLSVASVAVFSFVAVAVWSTERRKEREAYYRSETLRKIAEAQATGGTSAIEFLREEEENAARRLREGQKLGGLIVLAVGIGLMIFIKGVSPNNASPAYLVGLFPLLVGAALLVYAYLLAPKL
jgi:hypothetical protein